MYKEDWLMIGVLAVVFVSILGLFALIHKQEQETRAAMIERCSPNPDDYECQLYAAERGVAIRRRETQSAAMIGGMVGGAAVSAGRR